MSLDAKTANFVEHLALLPESERIRELIAEAARALPGAITVAERVLRTRAGVKAFARATAQIGDASSIRYWVFFCRRRLGERAAQELVDDLSVADPVFRQKAMYFMGHRLPIRHRGRPREP